MTEVHVQYLLLDAGVPVALVSGQDWAVAGLDSAEPETAMAVLEGMLTDRYGPEGWTIVAPAA